ncbi:MAG: type II secretion system F family protein, partial [Actinomycetota bacterium]
LIEATVEIAAAVRSGGSIVQGNQRAGAEVSGPLGAELRSLVVSNDSGVSLERGLRTWASDSGDRDVGLVVAVLSMHRHTGGDLPAVLDSIAETLRERFHAEREIASMTAQARLSGIVVGMLPVGFFAFLTLTSPGEMGSVMASPLGVALVGIGFGLEALAFLWIRRILRVEP